MPQINEYFPLNEDNIVVGIHGFGAIGGGYLAEIFSHWDGYTRPKEIIGATQNPLLINLVNTFGKYRIRYDNIAYFKTISHMHLIDILNLDLMKDMYIRSTIIGLSLPESVIRLQAETIAKCLINRYENTKTKLTLLIVMNKINAARFVKHHVSMALKLLTDNDTASEIIKNTIFIETVVNRMVSAVSEQFIISKLKNDLYHLYNSISDFPIILEKMNDFFEDYSVKSKKKIFKKEKDKINLTSLDPKEVFNSLSSFSSISKAISEVNITLFSAEPDMALYAKKGSEIVSRLRQVVIVDDISIMQEIKNKLSNGTHAIIAWYSMLLNYDTIGKGMGDKRVERLIESIIQKEIKPALLIQNPEYGKYIHDFISGFLKRCRNSFKDKCIRVGRDCMRKLQNNERIIGAIKLANKHNIETKGLEFGAACAILTCILEKNPNDSESIMIKKIYDENNSIADVLAFHGEYNKGTYNGLDSDLDKDLIERITNEFIKLKEKITQ